MDELEALEERYRELAERFFCVKGPDLENAEPGTWHVEACGIASEMHAVHHSIMHIYKNRFPKPGARFLHARLIGGDGEPQKCAITKVDGRDVTYALELPDGTASSTKSYISKKQFDTIVKEWL